MTKNATEAREHMTEVIEATVHGLIWKAKALRTIGLDKLADDLDFFAAQLNPLPKLMFDAIGKDLTRDLAASEEMSAGMLRLAMSGCLRSPQP